MKYCMALYLKKADQSWKRLNYLIKVELSTSLVLILIPLEVQGHTVPHLKALRYGKDGPKGLS